MELLLGDCKNKLKELEDNSIDAIVTDPPYGLSFMGKKWDYDVPSVDIWKECLRVLKPGGHLLAFSGTRTYHRMTSAIEDAGFEIRDMIAWVYGCLSEDTEVLTNLGWMDYNQTHKTNTYLNGLLHILIYDNKRKIYKWEKPERWNVYSVHKDTCYRIKSDKTDQLVSRNHNCYIEREGNFILQKSEKLSSMEFMPTLPNDFFKLQERQSKILFKEMQRILQGDGLEEVGKGRKYKIKSTRIPYEEESQRRKESCLERWSDLLQEKGQLRKIQDKICEMSRTIYEYGEKGWLCNGTQINNSQAFEQMFIENRSCSSQRPQSRKQQNRELNVIQNQQGTQNLRGFDITKAKVTEQEYTGIIYCPTTSTGLFVARRKGKIFITGNSGFPKSLNIGKAVDKLQGNEREVVDNPNTRDRTKHDATTIFTSQEVTGWDKTKGTSEWEGWGTALKPALEPICMARKPLDRWWKIKDDGKKIMGRVMTVAENVLKWGVGGINIDGCRVETTREDIEMSSRSLNNNGVSFSLATPNKKGTAVGISPLGRFPANLIHDGSEEVVGLFPQTKGEIGRVGRKSGGNYSASSFKVGVVTETGIRDSGSASRFFYCAKASKRERNIGCEGLEEKVRVRQGLAGEHKDTISKNSHPTVKPLALMEYLVKLVSKEGHTVLDPFMGSGTTGMACKKLDREFVGIEMMPEYMEIAKARINGVEMERYRITKRFVNEHGDIFEPQDLT